MLDFRIHTFLCVCRHMNYTKAAAELHITQPAVSQHIRYLENEYNAKLFDYTGKRLVLTPAGQLLLEAASTIRHDSLILKEKMQEMRVDTKTLSFGVTHTIGEHMVTDRLAAYLKKNPQVRMRLLVADTPVLLQQLDEGTVDIAVVEGFFDHKHYETLLFSTEPMIPVCGPQFSGLGARELTDLLSARLCIREQGAGTRELLERVLAEHSLSLEDFPCRVEMNSPQMIKNLLQRNVGFSFFYAPAVQEELKAGTLCQIALRDFSASHSFMFLWRKGSMYGDFFRSIYMKIKE